MKAVIRRCNRNLVPLLAVPAATSGFFDEATAAALVGWPDHFAEAEHSEITTAYQLDRSGKVVQVPYLALQSAYRELCNGDRSGCTDLFLDAEAVKRNMVHIRDAMIASGKTLPEHARAAWAPNAVLPTQVEREIRSEVPATALRSTQSAAAKKEQLKRLRAALRIAQQRAQAKGETLRAKQLPGTKQQLLELLSRIDPRIARSRWTFDAYCRHDLGWRWRQGGWNDGEFMQHL